MRIIGLDPGTRITGYGLVDSEGSRLSLVQAGTFPAPRGAPLEERLASISGQLREVLDEWQPEIAAVEDVFVKINPRAALSLGHARGALMSVLGDRGLAVASLAPASVKRAVAGNGRAGKEQVARMVGAILGTSQEFALDATDALAVAIARALSARAQLLTDG